MILVPGRINDELKGFSTVKAACEKLRGEGLEFDLRITAAHGMTTSEEWITDLGWTPQERVPDLYRHADLVIVPSLWVEPFGKIARDDRASVSEEGKRLLAFLGPKTDRRQVRFRAFRGSESPR